MLETTDRDLAGLQELGLELACTLETQIHADNITSTSRLRSVTGAKIACPDMDGLPCADTIRGPRIVLVCDSWLRTRDRCRDMLEVD